MLQGTVSEISQNTDMSQENGANDGEEEACPRKRSTSFLTPEQMQEMLKERRRQRAGTVGSNAGNGAGGNKGKSVVLESPRDRASRIRERLQKAAEEEDSESDSD